MLECSRWWVSKKLTSDEYRRNWKITEDNDPPIFSITTLYEGSYLHMQGQF